MQEQPYGFVAFWKATDSWFAADEATKQRFMEEVAAINSEARARGVQMFGNFDCSWSSEWRYFTFWLCPELDVLQETMQKLVAIGDINHFNIQHHYIGRKTAEELVQ